MTKFHKDMAKVLDLLLMINFGPSCKSSSTVSMKIAPPMLPCVFVKLDCTRYYCHSYKKQGNFSNQHHSIRIYRIDNFIYLTMKTAISVSNKNILTYKYEFELLFKVFNSSLLASVRHEKFISSIKIRQ